MNITRVQSYNSNQRVSFGIAVNSELDKATRVTFALLERTPTAEGVKATFSLFRSMGETDRRAAEAARDFNRQLLEIFSPVVKEVRKIFDEHNKVMTEQGKALVAKAEELLDGAQKGNEELRRLVAEAKIHLAKAKE